MSVTTVLYDGRCAICVKSITLIRRLDRHRRLAYLDVHDPATVDQFPALDLTALLGQIHVVDASGHVTIGYAGVCTILDGLPGWRRVVPVLRLPMVAWAGASVYNFVAARRYRMSQMLGWRVECDSSCSI